MVSFLTDNAVYEEVANNKRRRNLNLHDVLNLMCMKFEVNYESQIAHVTHGFTGHGIRHTVRIFELYESLLSIFLERKVRAKAQMQGEGILVMQFLDELFVLSAATIWHDAGMRWGREDHAKRIKIPGEKSPYGDIHNTLASFGLGRQKNDMTDLIALVAAAHSDNDSFNECKPKAEISDLIGGQFVVRAAALAAILRLCDELSDGRSRVTQGIWDSVEGKNKIYWLHSDCISESEICANSGIVKISYRINIDEMEHKYPVTVRCPESGENTKIYVSLYEFILNRIDKVHAEMNTCCPLFSDFVRINELKVGFEFYNNAGNSSILEPITLKNRATRVERPKYHGDISKYTIYNQATQGLLDVERIRGRLH